jgi:hypothetical protein
MYLGGLAESTASGVSLAWDVLAVCSVVLLALGAVGVSGVRARTRYHDRWFDRCRRLEAAIEAEHIVPALVEIITDVWPADAATTHWLTHGADDDTAAYVDELRNRLQSADVVDRLEALRQTHDDYRSVQTNYQYLRRYASNKARLAFTSLLLGLLVAADLSVVGLELPWGAQAIFVGLLTTAIVAAALAGSFARLEIQRDSDLVKLTESYL